MSATVLGLAAGLIIAADALLLEIPDPAPSEKGNFGLGLASLDDVDGDGIRDFAVSAPGRDAVYIFSGRTRTVLRTVADPDAGRENHFGFAMCDFADVTGDGVGELVVSGPNWRTIHLVNPVTGATVWQQFGTASAFARLGDVSGDGVDDLAYARVLGGGLSASAIEIVYALSGADGTMLWESRTPPAFGVDDPDAFGSCFGASLARVDDVTGDGISDLIASDPAHEFGLPTGTVFAGVVYVLDGATGTVFRSHEDPVPDRQSFGSDVVVLDLDGDGRRDDYVIGDPHRGLFHTFVNGMPGAVIESISVANGVLRLAPARDVDGDGSQEFWCARPLFRTVERFGAFSAVATDPAPVQEGDFGYRIAPLLGPDRAPSGDLLIGHPNRGRDGVSFSGFAYLAKAGVDLEPVVTIQPESVLAGEVFNLDVVIHNRGTDPALDGALMIDVAGGAEFTSFSCETADRFGVCALPPLAPGETLTINSVLQATEPGPIDIHTRVFASRELDPANDEVVRAVAVCQPATGFTGFAAPIGGADATGGSFEAPLRTFKLNSVIPVRFTLTDSCTGLPVTTGVHTLALVKWSDETTAETPIDATPVGGETEGNVFVHADGAWRLNAGTRALSTGKWQLRVTLADGSVHSAWIQLR